MNTISSLAILKVNWDRLKKDYIESFIPFIATLIKNKDYKNIIANKVCEDFALEYGIIIPYHPMITILKRAQTRGLIKRDGTNFIPDPRLVSKYDFSELVIEQQTKQARVISELINFIKNNYNVEMIKQDAETALLGFLKENDLSILFAARNATVLPDVRNTKSGKYLVCNFIKACHKSNPEIFKFITDLAVGHSVASILLYGDFEKYQGKFGGLAVFLDTRFILRLIGAEGNEFRMAYEDFLKMIVGEGVSLYIFEHTYEEAQRILEDCLRWVESKQYNPSLASPTLRFFIQNGYSASDIERFIVKVPEVVKINKVEKVTAPNPNTLQAFQIDEKKLHECIVKTYKEKNPFFSEWEKEEALVKDIKSIAAIYKLREGKNPRSIKDCSSIFVTTNVGLAYSARRFQIEERKEEYVVPACLTDIFIGTLMWLHKPEKMLVINENKIIAQCYAALQPNEELIKAYLDEIERLIKAGKISEEEYYLLRAHRVAMNLLEEMTLNDPDNFSDKTPEEILGLIKERIKIEAESKYHAEKEEHEITKKLLEMNSSEKNRILSDKLSIETNIDKFASILSLIIGYSIYIILMIFALIGSVGQVLPKIFPKNNYLLFASILIVCLFSYLGIITDFNIKERIIDNFINWLKNKIRGIFIRINKNK